MALADSYFRRADNAFEYVRECKLKITYKPQSADNYKMLSDHSLAEGYIYHSAGRHFDPDPMRMVAGMRAEQALLERAGTSAYDHNRFLEQVRSLIDGFDDEAKNGRHA